MNKLWLFLESWGSVHRRQLCPEVVAEFLQLLFLLPLAQYDLKAPFDATVTVSDASEHGGGSCASKNITQEGKIALIKEFGAGSCRGRDRLALLELFGGIGGSRRALELLGVELALYGSSETFEPAKRVCRSRWPGVIELEAAEKLDDDHLRSWLQRALHLRHLLLWSGPPCQDVSGLNSQGIGSDGPRSCMVRVIPMVLSILKRLVPHLLIAHGTENVSSMDRAGPHTRRSYNKVLGLLPVHCCSSLCSPCRRPRYYWINWALEETEEAKLHIEEDRAELALTGKWPEWAERYDSNTYRPAEFRNTPYCTFVRSIKRRKPPLEPKGLEYTSIKAQQRWSEDCFRYPPYQYEMSNLVVTSGAARPLNSRERAVRLGFGWNHLDAAFSKKTSKVPEREKEDVRCSLIGNSFSAPVIAFLSGQKLKEWGYFTDTPTVSDCWGEPTLEARMMAEKAFSCSLENVSDDRWATESVKQLARGASYKGSDVRLTTGVLTSPAEATRQTIDANRWSWKVVLSYRMQPPHINVGELHALLATFRWRARKASAIRSKFLHLTDSLVALGVALKCRSSSVLLHRVVSKLSALCLAASFYPFFAYVSSGTNPADAPSRWL